MPPGICIEDTSICSGPQGPCGAGAVRITTSFMPLQYSARYCFRYELYCADISPTGFNPLGSVITPNLFPGVSISADLGNGPGIQEVATFSVDVEGPNGSVAVANAHGTVTGAAGGVLLRPFARLISKAGDSVTTYGEPWNMN